MFGSLFDGASNRGRVEEQEDGTLTSAPTTRRPPGPSMKTGPFSPANLTARLWNELHLEAPETIREVVLRPSEADIAGMLLGHYGRIRNDRAYSKEWEARLKEDFEPTDGEVLARQPYTTRVRASEVANCARRTAMRLMRFPEAPIGEDSPHWQVSARVGELIHEELEVLLDYLGVLEKQEYPVFSKRGTFSGRVDARLSVTPAILDIKTVKAEDFAKGTYSDKVPAYIAQVSAYARLEGLPKGIILMVNRNDGKMLDFEWDIDPDFADAVLDRADWIVQNVAARKLPGPEGFTEGGAPSRPGCTMFCPFLSQCLRQQTDGSIQLQLDSGTDPKELF